MDPASGPSPRRRSAARTALLVVLAGLSIGANGPEDWRVVRRIGDVRIETRGADRGELRVRATRYVAAPPTRVRAVLLALEAFGDWTDGLATWRVLERDARTARVYGRHDLPWPLADRDYVVDYHWSDGDAGDFVLDAQAIDDARFPPVEGVVRVQRMETRWELRAAGDGTRVRYRFRAALGGAAETLAGWTRDEQLARALESLAAEVARPGSE